MKCLAESPSSASSQQTTKRNGFSYVGFLDRVLDDAKGKKFPIQRRRRDCERITLVVAELNRLNESGNVEALQAYMASLAKAAALEEEQ